MEPTAAAIDISLLAFFAGYLEYNYLIVGFFTFVLATAVNYVLSMRFVFERGVRFARHHEVLLMFGIGAVGLGLAVPWPATRRAGTAPL